MDNITASEIAGFGVGTLLLCVTIAAPKVDAFISASQRRLLNFNPFFLFRFLLYIYPLHVHSIYLSCTVPRSFILLSF